MNAPRRIISDASLGPILIRRRLPLACSRTTIHAPAKLEDDKAKLTNEIDTGLSKFTTGTTRTDKAISLATDELVQSGRGGKPKLIILLTDGLPTEPTLADAAFAKAHAADIKVQIVTIGALVSYLPMNPAWSTTGFPPIKMMNGYAELLSRIESILGAICQLTNVETAPPKT